MLRITQSNSAAGAVKYFDEGLSRADYYQDKEQTVGKWNGKGGTLLGLNTKAKNEVSRKDFVSLAYNQNTKTGEQLTPRMNEHRRVGYDFTFSVPKSVSIVNSLTGDKDIQVAFDKAVQLTMKELEKEAETRVRINGANENRVTGNLVWANFTHEDARPVNGIPDPHLHQHVFIFNNTYDKVEGRWKAVDISEIKASAPYYEAMFHNHLANQLQKVDYEIERNNRDFEIAGFDRTLIEKYSNRTLQMNDKAKELGLTYDSDKSELAARNREDKRTKYSPFQVAAHRKSRLSEREKEIVYGAKKSGDSIIGKVKNLLNDKDKSAKLYSAKEAVEHSISHHLERKSVTTEKEILREAYKLGDGSVSVDEINKALLNREDLLKGEDSLGRNVITTQEALKEEQTLIKSARKGKGGSEAINPFYTPKNDKLTDEQKHGVNHFLNSKDSISIISGGAGVGKTWSVKEVRDAVEEQGIPFKAFAPSSIASRQVQRDEGFEGATTIAQLLVSKEHQNAVKNGVIWMDESGLIGNKTMNSVIDLAEKQNARILLTGDIKQHNSVERGDAQNIIQKYGGIEPAYIKSIKRQQTKDYRSVVKDISEGDIFGGYQKLNKIGAIKEHEDFGELRNKVADEYAESIKKKENTLVIAATHMQGKAVTDSIRSKLKDDGVLKGKEKKFSIHENVGFTEVQKQDAVNYIEGMSVQFNFKRRGGVERGSKYDVIKSENGKVHLKNTMGHEHELDLSEPKMFSVYDKRNINVAVGDQLKITRNGVSAEEKRLDNGTVLAVSGFDRKGNIKVKTSGKRELVLPKDFRNFTHGYYTTSPSSQGKSVSKAIVVQGSFSGKAVSKEQFYVSVSRGKFSVSIHTDDKENLLRNIQRSSQRQTATEISQQNKRTNPNKDRLQRLGRIYKTTKNSAAQLGMAIKNKMKTPVPKVKAKTHGAKGI